MPQTFGEKIRALRKENGLTLDQLADKTESSKSYIWELENKNPPRPSAEKLSAIAGALGVTVDYLIGSDTQTLSVGGKNSKDCRGTWRDQRLPDG